MPRVHTWKAIEQELTDHEDEIEIVHKKRRPFKKQRTVDIVLHRKGIEDISDDQGN
jgi:hypothetical protein